MCTYQRIFHFPHAVERRIWKIFFVAELFSLGIRSLTFLAERFWPLVVIQMICYGSVEGVILSAKAQGSFINGFLVFTTSKNWPVSRKIFAPSSASVRA